MALFLYLVKEKHEPSKRGMSGWPAAEEHIFSRAKDKPFYFEAGNVLPWESLYGTVGPFFSHRAYTRRALHRLKNIKLKVVGFWNIPQNRMIRRLLACFNLP